MHAVESDSTFPAPAPLNFSSPLFGTCRISTLLREGKIDCKNCALPESVARRANRSAVQLNQMSRNRKSQTETALFPRYRPLRLPEAIEHVRKKLRRDSVTSIADRQSCSRFYTGQIDTDTTVTRCELDRVREQVPDYLSQPVWIAFHQTLCRHKTRLQFHAFDVSGWTQCIEGSVDYRAEVEWMQVEPEVAGNDS